MPYFGSQPTSVPLTSSDVADGIITNAKLAQDIISAETALAVSPDSTDEILISDSGTLKRIDYSLIGGANTPAFEAYLGSNMTSMGDNTLTKITCNTEVYDTDSDYDNSSNYRFTPTSAGKYFVYGQVKISAGGGNDDAKNLMVKIYKNGSAVANSTRDSTYNLGYQNSPSINIASVVAMNGSSDYLELYGSLNSVSDSGSNTGQANSCFFGAYKIIGA